MAMVKNIKFLAKKISPHILCIEIDAHDERKTVYVNFDDDTKMVIRFDVVDGARKVRILNSGNLMLRGMAMIFSNWITMEIPYVQWIKRKYVNAVPIQKLLASICSELVS